MYCKITKHEDKNRDGYCDYCGIELIKWERKIIRDVECDVADFEDKLKEWRCEIIKGE